MAIQPLNDKIVAKKAEAPTKTASGLLLGESKETPAYAIVEAVGPDVKNIKKSDKIIFKEFSATEVKIDDENYFIVEAKDVLAIIK